MRLMVYPASKEVSALARYRNLIKDFDEAVFVTPNHIAKDGDDFAALDGGMPTGISVSASFAEELERADAVFFAKSYIPISEQSLKSNIQLAKKEGKKIFSQYDFRDDPPVLPKEGLTFVKNTQEDTPLICDIPVPVVFVMGAGPYTNKFETQLSLYEYFKKKGYVVSCIGTKSLAGFFGFDFFTEDYCNSQMSIRDKIIMLNRTIYRKYLKERPDVMIIGIPGGFMQLNPIRYEEIGDMAYVVSQAVTPDASVLCTYASEFEEEQLEWLKNVCQYRLNAPINNLVIANAVMDISFETQQCDYTTIPLEFLKEKKPLQKCDDLNLFYALDPEDMDALGAAIEEQLANNL